LRSSDAGRVVERDDERIAGNFPVTTGSSSPAPCRTAFLYANAVRVFDYQQFAAGLRDVVRESAAKLAFLFHRRRARSGNQNRAGAIRAEFFYCASLNADGRMGALSIRRCLERVTVRVR
jgi:hypothetical protein